MKKYKEETKVFGFRNKRSKESGVQREIIVNRQEIRKIQELKPKCFLLEEEKRDWAKIKNAVSRYKVYCRIEDFPSFLTNLVYTGCADEFVKLISASVREHPEKDYIVEIENKKISPCVIN